MAKGHGHLPASIWPAERRLTGSNAAPSLSSLCEMAQWRKDYIAWVQKARDDEPGNFSHAPYKQQPRTNGRTTATNELAQ